MAAVEIDVDDLAEVLTALVKGSDDLPDPRIVDEDVDPSERLHGVAHQTLALVGIGDVTSQRDRAATRGGDQRARLLERRDAPRRDRDIGAGLGQDTRDRDPEPR